jgi:hypothetical protein
MKERTMIALGVVSLLIITWAVAYDYYTSPEEWRIIWVLAALFLYIFIPWQVVTAIRRQRRGEKRVVPPLRQRIIAGTIILIIGAVLVLLLLLYWHMI